MLQSQPMPVSPIVADVPFDDDGVHHGFLRMPYSRDDSAWGSVLIPITVVRNGDGPTALLTGANHGDEYEGPVALQALALELKPEEIRGRVIIVPFMNAPAFRAGTRTSPIDRGNLNRSFPGRADGTPTQKIADYFASTLAPMAKKWACQTFRDVTAMGEQVFGGVGFTLEYDIQLYFRRAKALQISWLDDPRLGELIAEGILDAPQPV